MAQQLISVLAAYLAMDKKCNKFSLMTIIENIFNHIYVFQIMFGFESFNDNVYNFKVTNVFQKTKS